MLFTVFTSVNSQNWEYQTRKYCTPDIALQSYLLEQWNQLIYLNIEITIMYNDHPWEPKSVNIVDKWALFIGTFMTKKTWRLRQ